MKNRHSNLSKHLNRNSIQLNNWPVISCLAPLFKGLFGRWLSAASITTGMDSLFGQRCVAGECFSLYSFLRPKCSSLYSWPPNKDEWHEEQRPANVGFGRESVIFYLDFGNRHIVPTLRPPDGILSLQSFMFLSILGWRQLYEDICMMNVPCHAIEKRVKIGNKASSRVLPTDILPAARG